MTMLKHNIPQGWKVKKLGELGKLVSGGTPDTNAQAYWNGNILWLTPSELSKLPSRFLYNTDRKISTLGLKNSSAMLIPPYSLIIATRATVGECCINKSEITTNQGFKSLITKCNSIDFLYYLIKHNKKEIIKKSCGSTFLEISKTDLGKLSFPIPPLAEQEKIAEILSTWDTACETLKALIHEKKEQKKYLMQSLLSGETRLKGFNKEWEKKRLGEISKCLDNLRVPLNGIEREQIKGQYPYCGANGIVDWISKYIFDTDAILIAEDGGYFDEFNSRPIAYRMSGKFWVNNHAHIIQSQDGFSQDFIFYSLEHKNIMPFLNGGTRTKLNKAEMLKIPINIPVSYSEQKAIADILTTADNEIKLLEDKLKAMNKEKKALMQKLLTGKVRVCI